MPATPKPKYVLTVHYARSETTYTFGPFDQAVVGYWFNKMQNDHPENTVMVDVLNPPKSYGTGQEEALLP
jgi:hypothetical protein